MTMKKNIALALSSAALILSVGCSDSSSSEEATTTGTAIDGYLSGANACIDANNDGVANDEVCTLTDQYGEYKLPAALVAANPVAITGGTDVLTGEAYVGSMSAPAGATVVTPLTTLVNAIVKTGKTPAEAQKSVNVALGLDENTDLVNLDPIRASVGTDATAAKAAQAVIAVQTKVQVIQQTLATTIAKSSDKLNADDAASAVADQMAAIITTAAATTTKTVEFSATELTSVVTKATAAVVAAATKKDPTAATALATATATIATVSAAVAATTSSVAQTAKTTVEASATAADAAKQSAAVVIVTNNEVTVAVTKAVETKATTVETVDVAAKVEVAKTKVKEVVVNPTPTTTGAQ